MRLPLPPVVAGLWIVFAMLVGLIWFGAAGLGIGLDVVGLWAAASAAVAFAIVASRGAPWSRGTSEVLAVVSAVPLAYFTFSSDAFVVGLAFAVSVAIVVVSARPWTHREQTA